SSSLFTSNAVDSLASSSITARSCSLIAFIVPSSSLTWMGSPSIDGFSVGDTTTSILGLFAGVEACTVSSSSFFFSFSSSISISSPSIFLGDSDFIRLFMGVAASTISSSFSSSFSSVSSSFSSVSSYFSSVSSSFSSVSSYFSSISSFFSSV
ncbi:hypothetical protein PENTCL1PPCAC_26374, partial [Pristionchus entomophagus]